MGGVLFIDEAYYLFQAENERDYGQESIEILLQVMENNRDDLVVILAGYADRMDVFFRANPGMQLADRAPHHVRRLHRPRARTDRGADGGASLATGSRPTRRETLRAYLGAGGAAVVRQRAQRPQRDRARAPAPGPQAARPARHRGRPRRLTTFEPADLQGSRVFAGGAAAAADRSR